MTTITIDENLKIETHFKTFFDFFSYIDKEINVEIEELENQNNILNSNEYIEYNNIFKNV
jgi:hypothetical protein